LEVGSVLKRLTHGLGAVAIVAATSFTMVYEAGPAQADIVGEATLLLKAAVGGGAGLAAASPEVEAAAGAVCATGVGCAVLAGGAAVAIGLYLTRDTWVPWVKNAFGGGPAAPYAPGSGTWGTVALGDMTSSSTAVDAVFDVPGRTDGVFNPDGTIQCKNTTTGATWQGGTGTGAIWGSIIQLHKALGTCAGYWYAGLQNVSPGPWITTYMSIGQAPYFGFATWGTLGAYSAGGSTNLATQARVSCVNPDGSTYEVIGMTQLGNGDALMPSCYGTAGQAAGGVQGAHGRCVTLSGSVAGAAGPFVDQSSNCGAAARSDVLYPNCVGAIACTYVIRHNGLPCTIGAVGCMDWPVEAESAPNDYQCFFGPYLIALAGCNVLERAYESGNGNGTTTGTPIPASAKNTDGDPRTWDGPIPAIAPPLSPRVPPSTAIPPTVTPDPNAPKPCAAGEACVSAPPESQDCFPSGYGAFNPGSWVLQPIKCALKWAFVPSSSFINGWGDSINAEWTGSPFGTWMNTIGGFGGIPIVNAGCEGPAVSTGFLGAGSGSGAGHRGAVLPAEIHPFDACSAPMSTVAATSNLILSAGIAFYGGMKVVRQLGWAFGFKIDIGSERSTFT
jgi:hypothetical protein